MPVRRPAPARRAPHGPASRRYRTRRRAAYLRMGIVLAAFALVALATVLLVVRGIHGYFGTRHVPDALATGAAVGPPYVVALDAGHGLPDKGAEGYVTEVDMTEATVDALYALLEADKNYTPVRTRQNGEGLSVAGRAKAAEDAGASLLLSVHGNYDETGTVAGYECYAQTPKLAYHEDSLRFAHAIADRMAAAGQALRGQNGVRYLYYEGDDESGYEKAIVEESDTTVRSEQTFGVLEKARCPAVLSEQCFLSHRQDADAWASAAGCQRAARLYYEAICDYFGTQPMG